MIYHDLILNLEQTPPTSNKVAFSDKDSQSVLIVNVDDKRQSPILFVSTYSVSFCQFS